MNDLFASMQSWWLTEEGGPGLLFAFRVISASLAGLAGFAWSKLARAHLSESTWEARHYRTFRVICWIKSAGFTLAFFYFMCSGLFEIERTSSPHRLIFGNVAWIVLFLSSSLLAFFLKFMFTRKIVVKAKRLLAERTA